MSQGSQLQSPEDEHVDIVSEKVSSGVESRADSESQPSKFQLEELQEQLTQADERVSHLSEMCRGKDLKVVGLEQEIEAKRSELQEQKDVFSKLTFRILTLKQETADEKDAEITKLREELTQMSRLQAALDLKQRQSEETLPSTAELAEIRQRLSLHSIETREMEQSLSALQTAIQKAKSDVVLLRNTNEDLRTTLKDTEANASGLCSLVNRQSEELERAKATLLSEQLRTAEIKNEALMRNRSGRASREGRSSNLFSRSIPRVQSSTVLRHMAIPFGQLTDRDTDSAKSTPRMAVYASRFSKTSR